MLTVATSLEDALPDHLIIEILSRLVETVGLRTSVAAVRSVSRLLRKCANAALEQSLGAITSRNFDAAGLCNLVRCVLYDRMDPSLSACNSPRFLSLRSVVLTGCKGVDAESVGLLLAHAPDVDSLQLEGTAVRAEETRALAHVTRTPIATFKLGSWTALHEAVSSTRRFADAAESGALAPGGALSGIYVDVCNERGLTPLLVAAYNGVTDAAEWLLVNGACPDAADCYRVSALMKAAYFGHASTVRALLAHGANSSRVDCFGAGALAKAAYRGHTAVVRLLLAAGARTDGEDLYGNRPLHSAVASGHRNIAMLLLKSGGSASPTDGTQHATAGAPRAQRRSDVHTPVGAASGRATRQRSGAVGGARELRVPLALGS